eukprot:10081482-Ditylum_brightwellii.AAC.1
MACQSAIVFDIVFAVACVAKEARCLALAAAAIAVCGGGFFFNLALLVTTFSVQGMELIKGINFDLLIFPFL